jgi:5'-3' exonuclease
MSPKTFIFIDGSYFCFHRYYSLLNWWKNAFPNESLENPIENTVFVEKFKKTFIETLQQIPKKLNLYKPKSRGKGKSNEVKLNEEPNITMIIGKDCKRENIWRNELYNKYKATRANGSEDGFMGGPFFKMVYEENLFQQAGAQQILYHSRLEADDCIAIYVKKLVKIYPPNECNIYIITSDNDYLQLIRENVHIYNLAFKNLKDSKIFTGNPEKDLKIKIIMGDTSDNLPGVNGLGPKKLLKLFPALASDTPLQLADIVVEAEYKVKRKSLEQKRDDLLKEIESNNRADNNFSECLVGALKLASGAGKAFRSSDIEQKRKLVNELF